MRQAARGFVDRQSRSISLKLRGSKFCRVWEPCRGFHEAWEPQSINGGRRTSDELSVAAEARADKLRMAPVLST